MNQHKPVMLITGARKGIGRSLAESYLDEGFQVVGCSRKAPDWEAEGYTHFSADVSREEQVRELHQFIRKEFKSLDVTLNNAGIGGMNHSMLMPGSMAASILNINFLGTFLVCRESAKLMKKNKTGRIVNFSTIAVPLNLEGEAVYAASKSAVEKFTRIFAAEVASFGITVNAVGPSPIRTDLINKIPEEKMQTLINRLSVKKYGTFADVKHVVDFFIDADSTAITGQTIYLGGV